MRVLIVLCMSLVMAGTVFGGGESFEDMDAEKILQNDEQRKMVFDCLMDRGPCGEYQKLRDTLPAMVETKCSTCTPKQKEKYEQVSKLMLDKYPKEFAMIIEKYSPKSD